MQLKSSLLPSSFRQRSHRYDVAHVTALKTQITEHKHLYMNPLFLLQICIDILFLFVCFTHCFDSVINMVPITLQVNCHDQ